MNQAPVKERWIADAAGGELAGGVIAILEARQISQSDDQRQSRIVVDSRNGHQQADARSVPGLPLELLFQPVDLRIDRRHEPQVRLDQRALVSR